MGLFHPDFLCVAGVPRDLGADSRFVRILGIRRFPGTSIWISTIANRRDPLVSDTLLCHRGCNQQHGTCPGRRDWLARVPPSAASSTNRFYLGMSLERLHLGGLALSSTVVRRL